MKRDIFTHDFRAFILTCISNFTVVVYEYSSVYFPQVHNKPQQHPGCRLLVHTTSPLTGMCYWYHWCLMCHFVGKMCFSLRTIDNKNQVPVKPLCCLLSVGYSAAGPGGAETTYWSQYWDWSKPGMTEQNLTVELKVIKIPKVTQSRFRSHYNLKTVTHTESQNVTQ